MDRDRACGFGSVSDVALSFMLRFMTAGESHGPGLVTIVEGIPKGLPVSSAGISAELARRRLGYGRGPRMSIEKDELEILGGVRGGTSLGSPIAVVIRNSEWSKWNQVMNVEGPVEAKGISRPRPGHADLAGMLKYETDDGRDILERASARETAARTVAGYLAKSLLGTAGVEIGSHVKAIGDVYSDTVMRQIHIATVDDSPVRCLDGSATALMVSAIETATAQKDTLGGVFEVAAFGMMPGIGSHVHYDRRLDAMLAGAVMSIPGIKGVQVGDGFSVARGRGSKAHDEIVRDDGLIGRVTNHAGGVEGGMSNGEPVRVVGAMKPISTLMSPLRTIDLDSGEGAQAVRERSDVCSVPAAAVVGEQMVAVVLAKEYQRKFGGDTVGEFTERVDVYRQRIVERLS